MLFNYPIAATNENWISVTLLGAIRDTLEAYQHNEVPLDFNDLIPDEYKAEFARGRKFVSLFGEFIALAKALTYAERELALQAMADQNSFPNLFDPNVPCHSLSVTLPAIHVAAKALFEYGFTKLSDLRSPGSAATVRENYHELVHAYIEGGCCPFCGLEILEAPDADLVNPDLDHYLAISKYPFAGTNLLNLTAMGTTCNRSYKGAKDILRDAADNKVECIDPFGNERVTLSLTGTVLLPGHGEGPSWLLNFAPDVRSRNWRRVFNIEKRLEANVLNKHYQTWLSHFVGYAGRKGADLSSLPEMLAAIGEFKLGCHTETLPAVAILKESFFLLIENALNDPLVRDRVHKFVVAAKS